MKKGKLGELIAQAFLIKKNFTIIQSNYFSNEGEIDIIATSNQKNIHFIEVKYYSIKNWINPMQAITQKKQTKIKNTATHFLTKCKVDYHEIQFDIIIIERNNIKNHILHAF